MSNEELEALRALRDADKTKRKETKENSQERAAKMAQLKYVDGLTLQAIGNKYGLTRERVRQIINEL